LKDLGFKFKFGPDFKNKALVEMFVLMPPRIFSLLSNEIVSFVFITLASFMTAGSLAIFNFASSLQAFPATIFGISFAVAAFPSLSKNKDNKEEFLNITKKTAKKIIFLLLPISVFYIFFRKFIVELTLKYGEFDAAAASLTSEVLLIFSFGILAQGLLPFMVRVFFSQNDTKTPFLTALTGGVISIILAIIFAEKLGPAALALASVCGNWINLLVLFLIFRKKLYNW